MSTINILHIISKEFLCLFLRHYFAGKPVNQSIDQSIPLFKCQSNIAVEEPLDGETIN